MKFYSFYDDESCSYHSLKNPLIFVFSSEKDFPSKLNKIKSKFKNYPVISVSTGGEISKNLTINRTLINILEFEKTNFEVIYHFNEDNFLMGEELIRKFSQKPDILIIFSNPVKKCNVEEVLHGINSVYPDIKIVGGLAGKDYIDEKTFIGLDNQLFQKGIIGIGLFNKDLQVETYTSVGWIPMGLSHKLTKCEKNHIIEIDNEPALKLYKEYLGEEVINDLNLIGVEFPLMFKRNNKFVARAIFEIENETFYIGSNAKTQEEVFIGLPYPKKILRNHLKYINMENPEVFFIFYCVARKKFIGESIYQEYISFIKTAPTFGFFTYGEINNNFYNHSITVLAIKEKEIKRNKYLKDIKILNRLTALVNIINKILKQLKIKEKNLKKLENELKIKTNLLQRLNVFGKIASFELIPSREKIILSDEAKKLLKVNNCNHWRKCLKYFEKEDKLKIFDFLFSSKKESCNIEMKINNHYYFVIMKKMKRKIYGLIINIDEIKKKDEMLIAQSRLAQMGEMINMIAHQWRQPINAISASVIKLELMLQMMCKEEDFNKLKDNLEFIQNVIQELSNTIDEFLYFSKPVSKLQKFSIKEVFADVLKLINTQLQNHNITVDVYADDVEFYSYKKEIEHILLNLITNARDILDERKKEDKKIILRGYKKGEHIVFEVEDNAEGIKVKQIEKIFEPYFTTRKNGTGLGLYMSKKIAQKKLNGDLIANNTKEGAKFILTIKPIKAKDD